MREFSLGLSRIARTAAETGKQVMPSLVTKVMRAHLSYRPHGTSNPATCSENRYPSPQARSVLPPCGPRHSFSSSFGRAFAERSETTSGCAIIIYARKAVSDKISAIVTTLRAEKCVNPSSFSPSFPRPSSRAACRQTVNAPSPVLRLAPSSLKRPTTTCSPVPLSARSRAPIATTQASATNPIRLTGASERRETCMTKSSPDLSVRRAFFVTLTHGPLTTPARCAGQRRGMI